MSKIPTIDEFYSQCRGSREYDPNGEGHPPDPKKVAVAFAKLQVTAALEAASQQAVAYETLMDQYAKEGPIRRIEVRKSSILNAYPLTNIK